MVEHTAVNRGVVGSSPTRGVKKSCLSARFFYNFILKKNLENEDKNQKKDFIYKKSLPNI